MKMKTKNAGRPLIMRFISVALVALLLAPSLLVNASSQGNDYVREVSALPYSGRETLRNDWLKLFEAQREEKPEVNWDPQDIVDVVIELTDEALLDVYMDSRANSIEEFVNTTSGKRLQKSLLKAQQAVLTGMKRTLDSDFELLYNYTVVMNGLAVRVPYRELEAIRSLDGVKTVFVAGQNNYVEPVMRTASDMTDASYVLNNTKYRGDGMLIAILDTGLDTDHEAFLTEPANGAYDKDGIAAVLSGKELEAEAFFGKLQTEEGADNALTADDVYVNGKVPFAFDYADNDADVKPESAETADNVSHGTHVAGIAAGYLADEEGKVTFSGVAPNAQLLIMKVFSDEGGGASDDIIIAALEDAIMLGADVINMSLGSGAGFTVDRDEAVADIYARVELAGTNLICSAGNDYDSAYQNNSGYNLSLAGDVDTGVVGSPSTYPSAMSVASIENTEKVVPVIKAGDRAFEYTTTPLDIKELAGEHEYVMIGGTGTPEDYAAAGDVAGKIAVVQRGSIAFTEKVMNGADAGAVAVIVYDNVYGNLINMVSDGNTIPAAFISKEAGEYLASLETKVLTVSADDEVVENTLAGMMSDFSSLGVTADLKLKPEITAPGGNIYSALPTALGSWGNMSGTSMSAPHMSGATALVRQYVEEKYPDADAAAVRDLVENILMCTAVPVFDSDYETYYTPRKQGSGLVNVAAAVTTPVYISTDADENGVTRPRLNLGDDPDRTGVYYLSFNVTNMSDKTVKYAANVTALMPYPANDGVNWYITSGSYELTPMVYGETTVTVPAGETKKVTLAIALTENDTGMYDCFYENGAYVDGFVRLFSIDGSDSPDLSVPFLAFYGNWLDAPILDHSAWYDEEQTAMNMAHEVYCPFTIPVQTGPDPWQVEEIAYPVLLGANLFAPEGVDVPYIPETFSISPNDDGIFDSIDLVNVGLLRNADRVIYSVTDEGGNVVYEFVSEKNMKTFYKSGYGMMIAASMYTDYAPPVFDGKDADGNPLPDGTRLTYTVTAEMDYDGRTQSESFSFPVNIDTSAPELKNMTVRIIERDGRRYLEGVVTDGTAVMNIAVLGASVNWGYIYPDYSTEVDDIADGSREYKFSVDISDIDTEYLVVFCDDYGYNENGYIIPLVDTEGLTLSNETMLIDIGDEAELLAYNNRESDPIPVEWSIDNESVATISESGIVTGVAPGNALVTATADDGAKAYCIVAVRDPGEVQEIKLSVENATLPVGSEGLLAISEILPEGVFRDLSGEDVDLEWTSSDPEVVAIENFFGYGYFTAEKAGTATVTATLEGKSASCTLTVTEPDGPLMTLYASPDYYSWDEYVSVQFDYQATLEDNYHEFYVGFKGADESVTAGDGGYVWTTSDSSIVSIEAVIDSDVNGVNAVAEDASVTADHIIARYVGAGTATITATTPDGKQSRSFTVYVMPNLPLNIDFTDSVVYMTAGETLAEEVDVYELSPREEDNKVIWKSFDENVATVDENGVITAVDVGYTMITGTLLSGYDNYIGVYVVSTDKSELAALANECGGLDMYYYQDGAEKDEFKAALAAAQAVLANSDATQAEIEAAYGRLNAALEALKEKYVDKRQLLGLLLELELIDLDCYTDGPEEDEFVEAFYSAVEVWDDGSASQTDVDAAYNRLLAAYIALSEKYVDKTTLEELVYECETDDLQYVNDENMEAYLAALEEAEAVLADGSATQTDVDAAIEKLSAARAKLLEKGNTAELEALVTEYEKLIMDEYIDGEAKNAFIAALEAAAKIVTENNSTQKDIDAARDALENARKYLVEKGNTADLEALIAECDNDKNEYVDDAAKKAYDEALKAAKDVLANGNATQKEVNAAYDALLKAKNDLTMKGDKTGLQAAVTECEALVMSGYVDDANKTAFSEALKAAKAVLENANATQDDVDKALKALKDAKAALVEKGDKTALQTLVTECDALVLSEYEDGAAKEAYNAALAAAKTVLANDNATQKQVDDALAALKTAKEGLVVKQAPDDTVPSVSPGTGDNASVLLCAIVALFAVVSIVALVAKKRVKAE